MMKTVDEVYPFGINTAIGPTSLVKEWFRNRHFFNERGYDVSFFAIQKRIKNNRTINELALVTEWPDNNSSATQIKKGNNWKHLLLSRKHALVESSYITSLLAYRRSLRINFGYIKDYINMKRTPDVVVFQEIRSCYDYLKNRKNKDAKVVVFVHGDGSDLEMFFKRRPKLNTPKMWKELLEENKYVFDNSDCIVWISRLARELFCKNHPEYAHKSIAVVNGINDIPRIKAENTSPYKYRLVTTGTVCERKGQYIIVEAMHRMAPEVLAETHLTIIGSGPDHSRLVSLAEEYGLKDHITFTGNLPNKEVPRYLVEENIYILMSNNEGLPISILEAMRTGLPVISTRVAGIPEEVDERNGFLLSPDIDQLTVLLNKLPEYNWEDLGLASRKRFEEEFTFERMMKDYNDMFDKLFI